MKKYTVAALRSLTFITITPLSLMSTSLWALDCPQYSVGEEATYQEAKQICSQQGKNLSVLNTYNNPCISKVIGLDFRGRFFWAKLDAWRTYPNSFIIETNYSGKKNVVTISPVGKGLVLCESPPVLNTGSEQTSQVETSTSSNQNTNTVTTVVGAINPPQPIENTQPEPIVVTGSYNTPDQSMYNQEMPRATCPDPKELVSTKPWAYFLSSDPKVVSAVYNRNWQYTNFCSSNNYKWVFMPDISRTSQFRGAFKAEYINELNPQFSSVKIYLTNPAAPEFDENDVTCVYSLLNKSGKSVASLNIKLDPAILVPQPIPMSEVQRVAQKPGLSWSGLQAPGTPNLYFCTKSASECAFAAPLASSAICQTNATDFSPSGNLNDNTIYCPDEETILRATFWNTLVNKNSEVKRQFSKYKNINVGNFEWEASSLSFNGSFLVKEFEQSRPKFTGVTIGTTVTCHYQVNKLSDDKRNIGSMTMRLNPETSIQLPNSNNWSRNGTEYNCTAGIQECSLLPSQ